MAPLRGSFLLGRSETTTIRVASACAPRHQGRCVRAAVASREASTSGRTESRSAPPRAARDQLARVMQQLQDLASEAVRLSIETGPRGLVRGTQAAQAIFDVASEYLTRSRDAPPQVVLRKLFERLGATYIKLGQFVASSPSLFPEEYVLEFQKCLDRTEPVPFADIKRTLYAELGMPLEQAFSYIDPTPLASASVAQVHEAVLAGSDKRVAIKVLKPRVEDVLTTDLNFLYIAAKLLQILNPELERTSIASIVEDIRESMLDEVDLLKEAANMARFEQYLDSKGMRAFATVPHVYHQYSSKRVITMEKVDGVPLTDLDAIRSVTAKDPETTLINALNTWLGSVMYCETFHADVHAGNLLVMRDGRVAFLDFGIVGRVSPVTWRAVEALLGAAVTGDYVIMARALATMKATDTEVNISAFARDLEGVFEKLRELDSQVDVSSSSDLRSVSANITFDDAQVNRLLLDIVSLGETHGIRFPREFGLLLKQVLYFDRYVQLLAPGLEVLRDSRVSLATTPTAARAREQPTILDVNAE